MLVQSAPVLQLALALVQLVPAPLASRQACQEEKVRPWTL